jgi:hypothetical protein
MLNIKPISDLRNYRYEKTQAMPHLMNELAKGRKSGEQEGWLEPEDTRTRLRARAKRIQGV